VRAGIEDNLWGPVKGQRLGTVEMINKMVSIAGELGRPIATAEETRQVLKLGEWYDTPEMTLFNLGLPPNREDGQRGFLTYNTDGKIRTPAETPSDPRYVL
jgi:beta-keto acid cleavage enzyme